MVRVDVKDESVAMEVKKKQLNKSCRVGRLDMYIKQINSDLTRRKQNKESYPNI